MLVHRPALLYGVQSGHSAGSMDESTVRLTREPSSRDALPRPVFEDIDPNSIGGPNLLQADPITHVGAKRVKQEIR